MTIRKYFRSNPFERLKYYQSKLLNSNLSNDELRSIRNSIWRIPVRNNPQAKILKDILLKYLNSTIVLGNKNKKKEK